MSSPREILTPAEASASASSSRYAPGGQSSLTTDECSEHGFTTTTTTTTTTTSTGSSSAETPTISSPVFFGSSVFSLGPSLTMSSVPARSSSTPATLATVTGSFNVNRVPGDSLSSSTAGSTPAPSTTATDTTTTTTTTPVTKATRKQQNDVKNQLRTFVSLLEKKFEIELQITDQSSMSHGLEAKHHEIDIQCNTLASQLRLKGFHSEVEDLEYFVYDRSIYQKQIKQINQDPTDFLKPEDSSKPIEQIKAELIAPLQESLSQIEKNIEKIVGPKLSLRTKSQTITRTKKDILALAARETDKDYKRLEESKLPQNDVGSSSDANLFSTGLYTGQVLVSDATSPSAATVRPSFREGSLLEIDTSYQHELFGCSDVKGMQPCSYKGPAIVGGVSLLATVLSSVGLGLALSAKTTTTATGLVAMCAAVPIAGWVMLAALAATVVAVSIYCGYQARKHNLTFFNQRTKELSAKEAKELLEASHPPLRV